MKNADKRVATNKNNKLRRSTARVEDSGIIRIFVADKKESWQPEKMNLSMKHGDIETNGCYVLLGGSTIRFHCLGMLQGEPAFWFPPFAVKLSTSWDVQESNLRPWITCCASGHDFVLPTMSQQRHQSTCKDCSIHLSSKRHRLNPWYMRAHRAMTSRLGCWAGFAVVCWPVNRRVS